jgi:DNA-directed RNA polymerase subunit M/transcription elongation factor TFIIS
MAIKIACPECGKKLTFADDAAGTKVRCKACDHRFKVRDPDRDDDEDDQPAAKTKKRGSKKSSAKSGVPIWVWAVIGGGAAALVLVVVAIVIIIATSGSRRGEQAGGNRPKTPDPADPGLKMKPAFPQAAAGPHAAIMEEFGASWNNAATALSQARDDGSAAATANQLRQEAAKLDQLTQRLRSVGRVSDADAPGVRVIQQRLQADVPRLESETQQLRQRVQTMNLTPQTAAALDQAMQAFSVSGKNFAAVGRQNIP